MSKRQLETKVGLFVFIGLVLLGALLLQFSKGLYLFKSTYRVVMIAQDVAGLKPRAAVMISGVQVGTVKSISLAENNRNVAVLLEIDSDYPVYKDARFVIETSGFLGDQYVSIIPTENAKPVLEDMDTVYAEAPFNFQEVARSATGIVKRVEESTSELNAIIRDMRNTVLADTTLTNLVASVQNLRLASAQARETVASLNSLVQTNSPALSQAVSNLSSFSENANQLASRLESLVDSNAPAITRTLQNVEASSESLKQAMGDLGNGTGLAGTVLRDKELALDVRQIAENLRATTDNLNRLGLWGIMWKRKEPSTNRLGGEKLIAPKYSR